MKEVEFLHKLSSDLYDGSPWIDVNICRTIADIDAPVAAMKHESFNSIWQIVFHIVAWRETVLQRLKGNNIPSPENNFFEDPTDISEKAWSELKERLSLSQSDINDYLKRDVEGLYEKPSNSGFTRFELINGLLQHDCYHLGQIVLVKKLLTNAV